MFVEELAQERRDALAAAKMFSSACESGDAEAVHAAADRLNVTVDGWRYAMLRVARLPAVSSRTRGAFLEIWIQSKMLPLRIGDRRVLSNALHVLMPSRYKGPPLTLYRGAMARERAARIYGFSWTTQLEIARDKFAVERRNFDGGSVVLETVAAPNAILLVRKKEDYFDEGEVIVDPFRLGHVKVVERIPPLKVLDKQRFMASTVRSQKNKRTKIGARTRTGR